MQGSGAYIFNKILQSNPVKDLKYGLWITMTSSNPCSSITSNGQIIGHIISSKSQFL